MTAVQAPPCPYPRCWGVKGTENPSVVCAACSRRFDRLLGYLEDDYRLLKTSMPRPVRRGEMVRGGARVYGHPAEWASVTAAELADVLNWTEDALRDHLRMEPPPHPGHDEARRVRHAVATLRACFNDLCDWEYAGQAAAELDELHGRIRGTLGQTRQVAHLPTPCPRCEVRAMTREVRRPAYDSAPNPVPIECQNCGEQIHEDHYAHYTLVVASEQIDNLINGYDNCEGVA